MVEENNNNRASENGHLAHGAQSANAGKATPLTFYENLKSWVEAIADVMMFILCSIGFILKDLYYIAFGYPEKELNNDIALVTGGGSGLGRLLSMRLGKMGTKVIVWDINKQGIDETVKMVQEAGGYCKGYVVDISRKEEVYKAAEVLRHEVGDISLLINNAGVVSGMHLLNTPDHLIERSFNVNVMAHFWTTKAFLPKMIENQSGHIVTIASLAGHVGITKLVDYCASKFAAVGFDEALRLELEVLGHTNIQTTCVCPFFIQQTGMFDDVNARWVPTLNPNDVADRVITAIKKNEKIAIIPGYCKFLLSLKWTFPWGCVGGLLRRLVPDASPHGIAQKSLLNVYKKLSATASPATAVTSITDISSTFKEPAALTKAGTLLIKRSPSLGERVL
ncbi:estradiol 17-beta-dehydrogenase 11-like [Musca domestica]|uniref:Estradiol 17-beta-dehydrogenase 11-like n=1 Tax=Musca domestica TaxID=7370 RepID=A0A1I8MP89_MUSDO|nr:estradiol 17-beta-dehydrogenase 11-like [Musca domestica]